MNNATLTADVNNKVNLVKSIANKTRGPYTPEKYGNVIIPMAIIRRFDCILADKNETIEKVLATASKIKGVTAEQLEEMVKRQCNVPFYNSKCVSLEQLVGEIFDESDEIEREFIVVDETHFEADGDMRVYDFFDEFDIDIDEDEDFEADSATVGGWTQTMLDGEAQEGDSFKWENLEITVLKTDGVRIERIAVEELQIDSEEE